jgi:ankyrin repeat protein
MKYNSESWKDYIINNNIEAIKYLLDNNLIIINKQFDNGEKWTLLMYASVNNSIEIVKLLLSYNGINVNQQNECGITPLMIVTYWGFKEIAELLLNYPGINILLKDDKNKTALDYAKERSCKERSCKEIENLLINFKKIYNNEI